MSLTRLPLLILLALLALWSCQQATVLQDFDGDGSLDSNDCQPSNPNVYPGAEDGYGDGIDQNCDGVDGNAIDQDGDNFNDRLDCDDNDPTIYPGANDPLGDDIDQNCDGVDGVAVDLDGDGYSNAVDCDDLDASIHPGAEDPIGDGIDQNCDDQDGVAPPGDDDDSAGGNGFVAPENCSDGFDNDQDGDIDCADPDCAAAALCLEDCGDGLDNDLDTATDCADPDCTEAATCQEDCGDGLDNDLDGDTDCEDSSCESAPVCAGDDDDSAAELGTWFGDVHLLNDTDAAAFCDTYDVISGALILTGSSVTNLNGLSCVTTIGSSITIDTNSALVSVSLPALTSVGGHLIVEDNDLLEVFSLPALVTSGESPINLAIIDIQRNGGGSTNGLTVELGSLTTTVSDLKIIGSDITALDLNSLETVGGSFQLSQLSQIQTISLPALTSVAPTFFLIVECQDLQNINAPLLETVDYFAVNSNPSLTNISFPQLNTVTSRFEIRTNPLLPTSQAEALRDQVQAAGGIGSTIDVSGNGPG